jgi:hypothetical protein
MLKEFGKRLTLRIQKELPEIYSHFQQNEIQIWQVFDQNFLTLNMNHTPIKYNKFIIDIFLLE